MNIKSAKKQNYIIISFLLFLLILFSTALHLFFKSSHQINYVTEHVKIGSVQTNIVASGEVKAFQLVTVGAQVSGQIKKLYVTRDQNVIKGSLIALIDSTTQENELSIKRALLRSYQAQLLARKITVEVAEEKFEREKALRRQEATSRENFSDAKSALAKATSDVAEMQSLISQTEISVKTAEANLGYTKITAPISGTIISLPVEEGQTINAMQIAPIIAHLADLTKMNLNIKISEADITKIKPGMNIFFKILSAPDRIYKTKLISIDLINTDENFSEVEKNNSIKTEKAVYYNGRALIDNDDGLLRVNMTAQCSIYIDSRKDVLVVPSVGINQRKDKYYVNILLENGDTEEREVKIGLSDNVYIEILSGLKLGENIIISSVSNSEIEEKVKNIVNQNE
ncbi:efflux RND transporter periplasmic adaptor subunit [Desulfovibrio sp.]|uniref:efflux RND transporter periplasmic adaptor subunit n=1 Tax=Desulfovibrio sp. TaxID=885 RepID=UPI0025C3D02D|nr:efflux RND transporter periplasmic adaptor subunit [Desulfovibrio sp.]